MTQSKVDNILKVYQQGGLKSVFTVFYRKAFPQKKTYGKSKTPCIRNFDIYSKLLSGKKGLEIGGPSNIFRQDNEIPVYPIVGSVDGCNFSAKTTWEVVYSKGTIILMITEVKLVINILKRPLN